MLLQCCRRSFNPLSRGHLSLRSSGVRPVQRQALRLQRELHHRAPPDVAPKFNHASEQESARRRSYQRGSAYIALAAFILVGTYVGGQIEEKFRDGFRPFQLLRRDAVSPSMSVFYLKPKFEFTGLSALFWPGGYRDLGVSSGVASEVWKSRIWHVFFKQPQIQVVRAYTPLPPISEQDSEQPMRFLIRHDRRGEVSSWLHRLPDGARIEMKGPNLEMEIPPETRHIIFLAGGTGIATALQAAYALLTVPSGDGSPVSQLPIIHILWASRLREDCEGGISDHSSSSSSFKSTVADRGETAPARANSRKGLIVQELDALKQKFPGQVAVDYFVDEEDTWISDSAIIQSIAESGQSDQIRGIPTHQMIISGPDGFIDYMAGPKIWREGGQEQGPVTGVAARALATTKNHYKVWKV